MDPAVLDLMLEGIPTRKDDNLLVGFDYRDDATAYRLPSGEVIIQTDFPAHPLYQSLLRHDYDAHAETLLAERRQLELPPCSRLALLRAEAAQRSAIERFLAAAHARGQELARASGDVRVYPAVAARMARRAGYERAHILVQSAGTRPLQEFLGAWRAWLADNAPRNVRWALDVDPQELD